MNVEECRGILSLVCLNLDRPIPEGLDVLWSVTLADIPASYGKSAALECITSSPFMPRVADLRSRAAEMQAADRRAAERQRALQIERAKTPAPERRADGAEMVRYVLAAVDAAKPVLDEQLADDLAARVEAKTLIAEDAIAEWRRDHPGSTAPPRQGLPCGLAGCRCTHTEGCDAGWIDVGEQVAACEKCNYRRWQILRAGDRREVAQRNLRDISDIAPRQK